MPQKQVKIIFLHFIHHGYEKKERKIKVAKMKIERKRGIHNEKKAIRKSRRNDISTYIFI